MSDFQVQVVVEPAAYFLGDVHVAIFVANLSLLPLEVTIELACLVLGDDLTTSFVLVTGV